MLEKQNWNADTYKSSMQNIEHLAAPALELLSQVDGDALLDLGCGDGRLTQVLINRGFNVVAIDASLTMVQAAIDHHIPALQMDARELTFSNQFDVVFSHAVLHWVKEPEKVLQGIYRALKPYGWFIAQFGGYGDTHIIRSSLIETMKRYGHNVENLDPWYNPTVEEYRKLLLANNFSEIVPTKLIPWHYALPDGMYGYVETFFSNSLLSPLSSVERHLIINEAVLLMEPQLCDAQGNWHADFVRLTVCAQKTL